MQLTLSSGACAFLAPLPPTAWLPLLPDCHLLLVRGLAQTCLQLRILQGLLAPRPPWLLHQLCLHTKPNDMPRWSYSMYAVAIGWTMARCRHSRQSAPTVPLPSGKCVKLHNSLRIRNDRCKHSSKLTL